MHKDGRGWDGLNLNLLVEFKLWRTGVKMAPGCSFYGVFLEKYCRLLSAWFSTHHMKACDCGLFYEQPQQFRHLITWLENFKSERQQDLRTFDVFRDGRCIYPFSGQVLTPVIPINTRHLSRPHRGARAAPHQFHSWVNHPTSHLYFQTHTHARIQWHTSRTSPHSLLVPKWANFSADLGFVWLY